MNENKPHQEVSSPQTAADIVVQKLVDWDVRYIFGVIGDRINPIVESLRKQRERIKFRTTARLRVYCRFCNCYHAQTL